MKLFQLILAIMLVAGTAGCSTYSMEGRYTYSSATDFSVFKSYAWKNADENTFATAANNTHFRIAMARALAAKGFTENTENPDFAIESHPVNTYREEYEVYGYGELDLTKKILRINFILPSSGAHIYEAVASAYNDPSWSQEEKNAKLDDAVDVILKKFPPGE